MIIRFNDCGRDITEAVVQNILFDICLVFVSYDVVIIVNVL